MGKKSWKERMLRERNIDAPLDIRVEPAILESIRKFNPGWELGSGVKPKLPPALDSQLTEAARKTLPALLAHSIEASDGSLRMGQ